MWQEWSATSLLVHLAALTYVIGFLTRDQLILRGLILVGTVFYIAYYYLEPATPLWDAIVWSVVMGGANAFTMMRIMADRRPGSFNEDDLVVYRALPQIAPSDFRRIMSLAEKADVNNDVVLTRQGVVPEYLYFVIDGDLTLEKSGSERSIAAPMFIGEIAYLLNQPASATVTLRSDGRYARWNVVALRELNQKHESLRGALEIAFNRDLAAKVAAS